MPLLEGDFVYTASIDLEFPKWDISVLPAGLKYTHRMLLKILHASYTSDVDLMLTLFYKRLYSNVEESISYILLHTNEYFKQKLPTGILVREWRLQLRPSVERFYLLSNGMDYLFSNEGDALVTETMLQVTAAEILEVGTIWTPHPIGKR